ncbi:unnamed protein product [Gadus morhua 'NCC']
MADFESTIGVQDNTRVPPERGTKGVDDHQGKQHPPRGRQRRERQTKRYGTGAGGWTPGPQKCRRKVSKPLKLRQPEAHPPPRPPGHHKIIEDPCRWTCTPSRREDDGKEGYRRWCVADTGMVDSKSSHEEERDVDG